MKLKLINSILFLCLSLFVKAQFHKQFTFGIGGQFDRSIVTSKNLPLSTGSSNSQSTVTNYGFGLEVGYFLSKNFSLSYNMVYQNWDANIAKTTSLLNGIKFEKIIPIQENLYFNLGILPFYEIVYDKKSYNNEATKTINHGGIFSTGISFVVDKNIILGTHLFRKFNSYPDPINGYSSFGGFSVSVKYVFINNLFNFRKKHEIK